MGKVKRGNYIFVWFKGDHPPVHVHIYKNGKLLARYNLEDDKTLSGEVNRKIIKHINELKSEGTFDEILQNKKGNI